MASRSAAVTQMAYLPFTATCLATYVQRKALLGGSHVAASPSPLDRLGLLKGKLNVPDDFDAQLTDDDLALFEGR